MKYTGVKSIAVNAVYLLGAHSFTAIARAVYVVVLARILGPELYGHYGYALSWSLAFLPFTMVAIDVILSREIGRKRHEAEQIIARILGLRVTTTLLAAIACAAAGFAIEDAIEIQRLLLIFSIALVGRSIAILTNSVFTAFETSEYAFRQEAAFRSLEVCLGIVILLSGGGLLGIAVLHAVLWWLQAIRGIVLIRRDFVPARLNLRLSSMLALLPVSIPLVVANIFGNWLSQGPIVLFRHATEDAAGLGQLALAMQAFYILQGIPLAIGNASLPVLSRAVDRTDRKDELFVTVMLRAGLIFGAAAGIAGMGAGPWFVELVFGASYAQAGKLLGPALFILAPLTCALALSSVLVTHSRLVANAVSVASGAVAMTVCIGLMTSHFGALGVILSTFLGTGIWAAMSAAFMASEVNIAVNRSLLRPLLAATGALLAFHYVGTFGGLWPAMAAGLIVLFALAILIGILSSTERVAIVAFVRNLY